MFGISLSRNSPQTLPLQLTNSLRAAVREGRLGPGDRLPASRTMAAELGVSRNIVTACYEQLVSEGYFTSRVGRGTFVVSNIEWGSSRTLPPSSRTSEARQPAPVRYDLTAGTPDLGALPTRRWIETVAEAHRNAHSTKWDYSRAQGEETLRKEIADYLFRIRGITVSPVRIVVTAGTSEALRLLAGYAHQGENQPFFAEDPSIPYTREAFRAAGYEIRALEHDSDGAVPPGSVSQGSVIYLTPSHQFPRGTYMPLQRRLAFLAGLAEDTLVLEDDYDSEFRFRGVPAEPFLSLRPDRVIYLGSFSKTLFPALRLGFVILPPQILDSFVEFKQRVFAIPPTFAQRALASFLSGGNLEAHLFRMKRIYARRVTTILSLLRATFPDVEIRGEECGYHLWVRFPRTYTSGPNVAPPFDEAFFDTCAGQGIAIKGDRHYGFDGPVDTDALVIGYGNIADDDIEPALASLIDLIKARL